MTAFNCPAARFATNQWLADRAADADDAARAEFAAAFSADRAADRRESQAINLALFAKGDVWVNEDGTTEVWVSDFTDGDVRYWMERGYTREEIARVTNDDPD